MKRIIIAGGRDFADESLFVEKVDKILGNETDIEIISGHASDADSMGEKYAKTRNLKVKIMPAEWSAYGRAAGPIRNKKMLEYVSEETPILIAFWNGKSKGTKGMIELAKRISIECFVIRY